MSDPGISFKSTTLDAAWRLLATITKGKLVSDTPRQESVSDTNFPEDADAADVLEVMAGPAGMRSRRVLLDGKWWRHAAGPMIARVAERRRVPRGPTPFTSPSLAAGTGWVALIPHLGTYRMRAADTETNEIHEWKVDAAMASRLAPFAFTFYRRFDRRTLVATDMLRFAVAHGGRDLLLLLIAGFVAALVGLFMPAATGWLIDKAIPSNATASVEAIIAALAVAGVSIIALDVLR